VPHDLASNGMIAALRRAGLDPARRVLVAWMGCTQYLAREAIAATLDETGSAFAAGSGIVFDYKQPPRDPAPEDAAALEAYMRPGGREPWLSVFADGELPAMLAAAGWTVERDIGAQEVMAGYLADRKDGLRFPGYTRIVYAKNQGREERTGD